MIALVFGVIKASNFEGSRFNVTGSASTTTGVAPARTIAAAHEIIVKVGKITSSPGPIRNAASATSKATDPFITAIPYRCPAMAVIPSSSFRTNGPSDDIQPVSTHSAKYLASFPFSSGSLTGIILDKCRRRDPSTPTALGLEVRPSILLVPSQTFF